jgi:hypothetical protein
MGYVQSRTSTTERFGFLISEKSKDVSCKVMNHDIQCACVITEGTGIECEGAVQDGDRSGYLLYHSRDIS